MLNKDNFSNYYSLKTGLLIVVSGPSGAGKSLITQEYIKKHPEAVLSISETTRSPRKGELNGREYYFVNEKTFLKREKEDYYLESAGKYQNRYGTPKKKIIQDLKNGKDVILEIETQGAEQIRKKFPDVVSVFVLPTSFTDLEKQIRGRKTETEEAINLRLSETRSEVDQIKYYDFVLINRFGYLDESVKALTDIIKAERYNVKRILNQYK